MTMSPETRVVVGLGSCGVAAGARKVRDALARSLGDLGIETPVGITGCIGLCHREPLVELESPALGRCLYGDVTEEVVPELVTAHFREQRVLAEHLVWKMEEGAEVPAILARQVRIVLRDCGRIDPGSLEDYLASGGYRALPRVLREMEPEALIAEVEASGLRGRGGAGFLTGRKWRMARAASGPTKAIICNADEGDPGAFMDRNIIEGDPFGVLEGMAIAAWAIGASEGFIYVREEYPLAVKRFERAVALAREAGWLGEGIAGTDFDFDIQVRRGAGAFVCGEETALIASLEGRRGVPRQRPPYPVEHGLFGWPTAISNVETFHNVPWIVEHGAEVFRRHGTEASPGTKVFSLAGDVRFGGMIEVPMGITLREVLEDIGGGSSTEHPIKAVQIGGPSGGCLPAALFDTPIDFESLAATGAIMGSGGLVAMDSSQCMVDIARFFLSFAQNESCGKCTFCRVGTKRLLEMMERVCAGEDVDLEALEALAHQVRRNSVCGLGQTAPNAVLTTLRYFREEYEAHIYRKCCPAGRCRGLITYAIDGCLCDRCTTCLRNCASKAIHMNGQVLSLHIDPDQCDRCGVCIEVCQFGAVSVR
jgi:NADH-quinone oxidoreductase subunit F